MKIGSTEISNIKIGSTSINRVIKDGVIYWNADSSWTQLKNNFKAALQGASLWDDNDRIFLFADAETPYTDLTGKGTDATVVTGALHESGRGVYQNNGIGYINSNYNAFTNGVSFQQDDCAIVTFFVDDIRQVAYPILGQIQTGVGAISLTMMNNSANAFTQQMINSIVGDNVTTNFPAKANGVHIYNRVGSTVNYWYNGNKLQQFTRVSTAIPNGNIGILAGLTGATAGNRQAGRIGLQIYRAGLSDVEASTFSNIVINTMQSYGAIDPNDVYENEFMSYFQTGNKCIQAQRDNYCFATNSGNIHWSENGRSSWTSRSFATAGKVEFGHIFSNGNLLFADYTKIYLWSNKSNVPVEVTPTDWNATPISIHTPVSGTYPGNYYKSHRKETVTLGGRESVVWGNYGNTFNGANPVFMFHAFDDGTVKIDHKFGQNLHWRDNGLSATAEQNTGTILGDAGTPGVVRHVHNISYDSDNNIFYMTCGDAFHTGVVGDSEIAWYTGTYNSGTDRITYINVYTEATTDSTPFKTVGLRILNGYVYFGSEGAGNYSIRKTTIANLFIKTNHQILLTNASYPLLLVPQLNFDGITLYATSTENNVWYISKNSGTNWTRIELTNMIGPSQYRRDTMLDSNNYFVMCTNSHNYMSDKMAVNIHIKFK